MAGVHVDVCVVGAGPAGSALALRLAHIGHSVAIVESRRFPRAHIGESLPPSVLPLLHVLGVRDIVESAGFIRPSGTRSCWTGSIEWREADAEPGFQVDRSRFDALLLNAARAAGARVLQPARIMSARRAGDRWSVLVQATDGTIALSPRLVADASGRRGWLPRGRRHSTPRTIALTGYWSHVPIRGLETRVEAGERQWYWGAPLAGGVFVAAVFVDAEDYSRHVRAGRGRDACYDRLLADSTLLNACLQGRRLTGVHVCDASAYADDEPATCDSIKVGEAAFAIDPISSQGVQTAIGSALHAAAVAHTIVERPGDAGLAVEFYRGAQRQAAAFHARAAGEAYAAAAAARDSSFWQRRAVAPDLRRRGTPDSRAPLCAESLVQLADDVRIEPAGVLSGDLVVPGRHVTLPGGGTPIAYLGGVELAGLLEMAQQPVAAERLARAWTREMPFERAEAILAWLWSRGALHTAIR